MKSTPMGTREHKRLVIDIQALVVGGKDWSSFNKMVKLMNKPTLEERKAMVHAWGETNITHYMV